MRRSVVAALALFLLLPAAAHADFVSLVQSAGLKDNGICKGASAGDPSSTRDFGVSDASSLKTFLQRTILCPSACFNEQIDVSVSILSSSMTVKTVATNKCTKTSADPRAQDQKKDNRGCAKGDTQPSVIIHTPGVTGILEAQTIGPKSRCDTRITDFVDSMFTNVSNHNIAGVQTDIARLQSLPETYVPFQGGANGTDRLISAFEAANYTKEQAQAAIEKDPVAAAEYISAINSGDQAKLTAAAKKLDLNDDLSQINTLAVKQASYPDGAYPSSGDGGQVPGGDQTFNSQQANQPTDMDKAKCAIANIESGSCGGNYGTVGPVTRNGDQAYGKYQVMGQNIPSWTAGACGQAMSAYQFLQSPSCQEAVFEQRFGSYVNSCGSYEGAASKWFSGRCNVTNSNDGWMSVPSYVRKFASVFGSNTIPFGAQSAIYTAGASPFAQVNPLAPSANQARTVCTDYGYCYLDYWSGNPTYVASPTGVGSVPSYSGTVSTGQPVSTGGTISTGAAVPTTPVSQQVIQASGSSTVVVQPVVTLLVQPAQVKKGTPVSISWSSVGMRSDQLCQLFAGTTFLAQGNEGTRTFDTSTVSAGTSLNFVIQCFAATGVKIQKTATSTVQ